MKYTEETLEHAVTELFADGVKLLIATNLQMASVHYLRGLKACSTQRLLNVIRNFIYFPDTSEDE